MSNPSFSNIDRWLFELYEGNLSPEQVQQLEVFLLQHPELEVDRDMWELAKVEKTEVVYPHQDKFIRRKPVGLYMMAGFTSIAIFILIGVNLFMNLESNSVSNGLVAKHQLAGKKSNDSKSKDDVIQSKERIGFTENSEFEPLNDFVLSDDNKFIPLGLSNAAFRGTEIRISNNIDAETANQEKSKFKDLNKTELDKIEFNQTVERKAFSDEKRTLKTKSLSQLDVLATRNWIESGSIVGAAKSSESVHSAGMSTRLSKATRALTRMMDNPVALKNLKDPNFHLPGMLPADVNFGNTGTLPATRIQTLTRLQWPNQKNQQLINQLALDSYVYAIRGGVGLQVNHAFYGNGEIMNSAVSMTYSPKISVNRNILIEPALRFKMGNKSLDPQKIDGFGFAEMDRENVQSFYPNGTSPVGQQLWYRDLGVGLMINTKWFFVGVQGDNLFRHYDNIYSGEGSASRRVGQHFIATIGTDYESKRELIGLSPYFVYQQREALKELWMGVNTRVSWFTTGIAVSDRLDAVASAGLKFSRFALSYQLDYTKSALWNKQLLSHQLSFKFISFNQNKKQKFLNL